MLLVYAETRSDRVEEYLSETPSTWPFMDRVLAWLAPTFRPDIERYYASGGPSMAEQMKEHQLEAIDRLLLQHIERRLRAPAEQQSSLDAELHRLRAENEELRRQEARSRIRVSEKGAVSVYGLGRYPVTLYQEQWVKLLELEEDIRAFILENTDRLAKRPK